MTVKIAALALFDSMEDSGYKNSKKA